jgi:hypothetical protein
MSHACRFHSTAAVADAYRKLLRDETLNLLARNLALHRMLVDGVNVEYTRSDSAIAGAQAQVIDFEYQIVSRARVCDKIVDIFAAAELKKPDIWPDP